MMYEISGPPVAWCSHRGYGRKSFNPHYKEKEAAQWELKRQHGDKPLYCTPLAVDFEFIVPIPKSLPKKTQKMIEEGKKIPCSKRPDRTNYIKHAEDCMTGIVWEDDNLVVEGSAAKYYGKNPRTTMWVYEKLQHLEDICL